MMASVLGTSGNKKAFVCKRVILWWFTGRLRVKAVKITALAVIAYNVLAFVLMWCPPVRGIVVDKDTGAPIAGAEVLKAAEGFFFVPAVGGRYFGATGQARTGSDGRFSFAGTVGRPSPNKASWFNVLWPFQWIDTIHVAVWDEQYIGADSGKQGLCWGSDIPRRTAGNSTVERFRLPILGYWYKIKLSRPQTEADWQEKIGSVSLYFDDETRNRRLFTDLTGYLERWPEGEKAGEYYRLVWETAALGSCDYMREELANGELTRAQLRTLCDRAAKIVSLAEILRSPPEGMTDDAFRKGLLEHRQDVSCARALLGEAKGAEEGRRP